MIVEHAFNIDIAVINKFGFLKVSPPLGTEDLEQKIKELEEKREYFIKEGERKLAEDVLNVEEFEINESYNHDDDKFKGKGGDRDNRRDGNDRHRAGKGQEEEKDKFREKMEFEADDEDEEQYHKKEKKSGAERAQKKEDLKLD